MVFVSYDDDLLLCGGIEREFFAFILQILVDWVGGWGKTYFV